MSQLWDSEKGQSKAHQSRRYNSNQAWQEKAWVPPKGQMLVYSYSAYQVWKFGDQVFWEAQIRKASKTGNGARNSSIGDLISIQKKPKHD